MKKIISLFLLFLILISANICVLAEDKVLFFDEFDTNLKKWESIAGSGFVAQNNKLTFKNSNTSLFPSVIVSDKTISNGEIQVSLIPKNGKDIGILFRFVDINTHYLLNFKENKIQLLKKVKGGTYSSLKEVNFKIEYNKTHIIDISLNNENIVISVNNEKIMEQKDASITTGKVGFCGNNCEFDVDSLKGYQKESVSYDEVKQIKEDDFETKKDGKIVYVSPEGNDKNDGSENSPLKTLLGAKKLAKSLKKGKIPVTVIFKEGLYPMQETVTFTAEDSGYPGAPIIYKAQEGAKVVFSGATEMDVGKFKKVTDKEILSRLPQYSKNNIVQMDLEEQGLTYKNIDMTGAMDKGFSAYQTGIFLNGKRQSVARWPNFGYKTIGDVGTQANSKAYFTFSDTNPARWTKANDLFIEGYLGSEWYSEWVKVQSVDSNALTITLANPLAVGDNGKPRKGFRWAAVNLLEELDIAGEWFIDKSNMMLYYYPPYELVAQNDKFEIATMMDCFVKFSQAQYISFEGLRFEKTSDENKYSQGRGGYTQTREGGNGIVIEDSKYIKIYDCEISDIARIGIYLIGAYETLIEKCRITNVGGSAMFIMKCGDRQTLTPCNTVVRNNVFYRTGLDCPTGMIDVQYNNMGVGLTFENNIFHSCPQMAMFFNGNDNIIRNNEIYNVVRKMADMGALYTGRNMSEYGNRIEYNYMHDFSDPTLKNAYVANAVFYDDNSSGGICRNNIINYNYKNNTSGIKIGGGRDFEVVGNTVVNVHSGIVGEDRTTKRGPDYIATDVAYQSLFLVPFNKPPYSEKYPNMAKIPDDVKKDGNIFIPKNNNISDNLFVDIDNQQIASAITENGTIQNNVTLDDYSIFVDAKNQDFRVKNSAKKELKISDEVLDENFNIDSIGIDYDLDFSNTDFSLLYPKNNDNQIERQNVQLKWQNALYADEYEYTVAKDKEFKDIICQEKTLETICDVENIQCDETYYWKVKARNISRKFQREWESEVFTFTTLPFENLNKSILKKKLDEATLIYDNMNEGNETGEFKIGSRENFKKVIDDAKEILDIKKGTQKMIDEGTTKINASLRALDFMKNVGYKSIEIGNGDDWKKSKDGIEYSVSDGTLSAISELGGTGLALDKKLPNSEIVCFDTKFDKLDTSWIGYSIRQQNPNAISYSVPCYLVVVKENVFELQYNGILTTCPNNGIMKHNEWNHIEFGAVNTPKGVNVIFKVNDTVVFDYLDSQKGLYDAGVFSITVCGGNKKMQVKQPTDIPTEKFLISQNTMNKINGKETVIYDTKSQTYEEIGIFKPSTLTGYTKGETRVSNQASATAKWLVTSDGIKTYKVSYYHKPIPNGDKKVEISCDNYKTEFKATVDMSAGEEGFVEIGEFTFISANISKGDLAISFKCSGTGEMPISAIKIEEQQ